MEDYSLGLSQERSRNPLYRHVAKTYGWMFLGLAVTFAVSYGLCVTGFVLVFFALPYLPFVLLAMKLGLVIYFTHKLHDLTVTQARGVFLFYSVLSGIALTPIFLMYSAGSLIMVFGVTALFFGLMAGAGLVTKRDVSRLGPMVLGALAALLMMEVVNLFFSFSGFEAGICFAGLLIFLGVTTYDSKKVKDLYAHFAGDESALDKISVYCALELYLDFINVFLYLLRLFGKRR